MESNNVTAKHGRYWSGVQNIATRALSKTKRNDHKSSISKNLYYWLQGISLQGSANLGPFVNSPKYLDSIIETRRGGRKSYGRLFVRQRISCSLITSQLLCATFHSELSEWTVNRGLRPALVCVSGYPSLHTAWSDMNTGYGFRCNHKWLSFYATITGIIWYCCLTNRWVQRAKRPIPGPT